MTLQAPSKHALSLLADIASLTHGFENGLDGSREGLLNACSSLISELRNPSENMTHLIWAQPTHLNAIWMSVEVGLFEALADGPESGASLADITKRCNKDIDAIMVGRMLRHLASMGTVRETGPGMFAPTPTSLAFAEKQYQDSILFMAQDFQPVLQRLPSYFQQRKFKAPDSGLDCPFQHNFDCKGTNTFEYFATHNPEMARRFASMMQCWSTGSPRWFHTDYYPVQDRLLTGARPDTPFLVDIGGGAGQDIEGLRLDFGSKLPGPLILQDRPEVVALAHLGPGAQSMAHDFFKPQPVAGARAYLLHSIIHDWNDDVAADIIKAIVPAMERGYSKLLVHEVVFPNHGAHWLQSKCSVLFPPPPPPPPPPFPLFALAA